MSPHRFQHAKHAIQSVGLKRDLWFNFQQVIIFLLCLSHNYVSRGLFRNTADKSWCPRLTVHGVFIHSSLRTEIFEDAFLTDEKWAGKTKHSAANAVCVLTLLWCISLSLNVRHYVVVIIVHNIYCCNCGNACKEMNCIEFCFLFVHYRMFVPKFSFFFFPNSPLVVLLFKNVKKKIMATDFLSVFSRGSIVPEQRDADWLAALFKTLIKAFAAIWRQQHPCNLLVNHRPEKFLAHFLFPFI